MSPLHWSLELWLILMVTVAALVAIWHEETRERRLRRELRMELLALQASLAERRPGHSAEVELRWPMDEADYEAQREKAWMN